MSVGSSTSTKIDKKKPERRSAFGRPPYCRIAKCSSFRIGDSKLRGKTVINLTFALNHHAAYGYTLKSHFHLVNCINNDPTCNARMPNKRIYSVRIDCDDDDDIESKMLFQWNRVEWNCQRAQSVASVPCIIIIIIVADNKLIKLNTRKLLERREIGEKKCTRINKQLRMWCIVCNWKKTHWKIEWILAQRRRCSI